MFPLKKAKGPGRTGAWSLSVLLSCAHGQSGQGGQSGQQSGGKCGQQSKLLGGAWTLAVVGKVAPIAIPSTSKSPAKGKSQLRLIALKPQCGRAKRQCQAAKSTIRDVRRAGGRAESVVASEPSPRPRSRTSHDPATSLPFEGVAIRRLSADVIIPRPRCSRRPHASERAPLAQKQRI
jgi:hypothetical protein